MGFYGKIEEEIEASFNRGQFTLIGEDLVPRMKNLVPGSKVAMFRYSNENNEEYLDFTSTKQFLER